MDMKTYTEKTRITRALEPVVDLNSMAQLIPEDVEFSKDAIILGMLLEACNSGNVVDLIKRGLFYSDPKLTERRAKNEEVRNNIANKLEAILDTVKIPTDKIHLLHATIGMVTEASEALFEVVSSIIEDRPVDKVNLREEGGDEMWYQAWLFDEIGSDFEDAGEKNIEKLSVRYKDKFDKAEAVNRNLDAEKIALGGTE